MFPEKFIGRFASSAINHVLRQNTWSLVSCKMHCGKNVRFCLPLQEFNFVILENGELSADVSSSEPNATIYISSSHLPRLLLGDITVWREIETSGEVKLSATLISVFEGLLWDIEDDLSQCVGDIPAHYLINGATLILVSGRQAAFDVGRALAEYWIEERALLVKASQVEQFSVAVASVVDAAKKFERRFESVIAEVKVTRR